MAVNRLDNRDFAHEADDTHFPGRRRRIGMACIPCRSRKVRCDGSRPKCSACSRNCVSCTYQPASQMINVSREYILNLKQRAEAADGRRGRSKSDAQDDNDRTTGTPEFTDHLVDDPVSTSRSTNVWSRSGDPQGSSLSENISVTMSNPGPDSTINSDPPRGFESFADGLSHMRASAASKRPSLKGLENSQVSPSPSSLGATTVLEEPHPDDFYGPSSNHSFMYHTVQTNIIPIASSLGSGPSESGHRQVPIQTGPQRKPHTLQLGVESCLPQRAVADELVECFFRNVHILYPFIHRPTFETQYKNLWIMREHQDPQWLSMLNVIFALGIHFDERQEDKSAASDRFFGYAQKLLTMEHLAQANLQTLQLLLLCGLYYQSTSRPNQSWNAIGLAIRVATTIGVHIDPTPVKYDPIQLEIRRRCWYGCIVLDRVLAVGFGRPSATTSTFGVSWPSNLDDEYITETGYLEQPAHVNPKTDVFIQSIAFSTIMKDVLGTLYQPLDGPKLQPRNGGTSPHGGFKDALGLDQALVDWLHRIPDYLRVGVSNGMEDFRRTRNILLTRFFNLRILIHRPFVAPAQRPSPPTESVSQASLDNALHAMSVTVCRSAAIQLAEVISTNYYQGMSSAWWIDLNYLFTAATALLAIEFQGQQGEEDNKATTRAFNQCLSILRAHRHSSTIFQSYVSVLEEAKKSISIVRRNQSSSPSASTSMAAAPAMDSSSNSSSNSNLLPRPGRESGGGGGLPPPLAPPLARIRSTFDAPSGTLTPQVQGQGQGQGQRQGQVQGQNLDDFWQQQQPQQQHGDPSSAVPAVTDSALPSWNMQDLFVVPWDMMMVDDPMQSCE